MKRKNFRLSFASLVVFLLVGVLCAGAAFTSLSNNSTIASLGSTNSAIHAGTTANIDLENLLDPDKVETHKTLGKDDEIGLIVTMDDSSLVDIWLANPQGYKTFGEFRSSTIGRNAAENLINKQRALFNKIARNADVTMKYNYVNTMNGFAIDIKYGDRDLIDAVAARSNVLSTSLSTHYDVPTVEAVENQVTAYDTGIFDSEYSIYENDVAGQNTVAAILDTGIDWEHVAFSPDHPLFRLQEQITKHTLRFDEDYIKSKLPDLLTYARVKEDDPLLDKVSAKDLYINEKIPFAFDYADADVEVSSDIDNAHGTHVAGIVAGHSDTPYKAENGDIYLLGKSGDHGDVSYDEAYGKFAGKFYKQIDGNHLKLVEDDSVVLVSAFDTDEARNLKEQGKIPVVQIIDTKTKKQITGITGVAPQAQLAVFKVFPDLDTGANSESLLAAIEDCMTLDVDVINMSLGSDSGFEEDDGAKDSVFRVYDKLDKTGISLIVAASNSMSSGFNSHYGLNLISNPDSATVGSPASYPAAFSVASISGVKSKYLTAINGKSGSAAADYGVAYYLDSAHVNGEAYDFYEDLEAIIRAKGLTQYIKQGTDENGEPYDYFEVPYVSILGVGNSVDYSGKDVTDKIALVARGDISFEDKIKIANDFGALACVIYNNAAGIIRMQVGDDIKHTVNGVDYNFPACSITMDAAASIKNKDIDDAGSSPKLVFDSKAEAGPFMSDFTSWGPLPNLKLKPEITAHGGEIYSSIPGDETAYSRFSGTSMACPNMAGVVTLLRQFMKIGHDKDNPELSNIDKFDLWAYEYEKDGDNFRLDENGNKIIKVDEDGNKVKALDVNGKPYIDTIVMERRIYQILMSTTTIANDEEGNPYSPRRQGSGLADLNRSETTSQYLYVKDENGLEKDRTKLELFDDPTRSGVYDMTFYVKNVGSTAVNYNIKADVFTEGMSTDGKTVSEKARLLTYDAKLKLNDSDADVNSAFSVAAGAEVKITYTVTLTADSKEWLEKFPNGMYVEGFVRLINTSDAADAINLNIPYLAFYGDWSDAPIMDYDVYETTKDANDDNIDEEDKRYSNAQPTQMLGKIHEYDNEYTLPVGQFPFNHPEEFDVPDAEEDKCAFSFNEDASMCSIYCVGGFLRGVKKMFYEITDVATGEVIYRNVYLSARKSAGAGGFGGAWLDLDIKDLDVVNNGLYNITIYPIIDWKAENYPHETDEDIQKSIAKIVKEGVDWNNKHQNDGKAKKYCWSSDFWIDTDAPFLSDTQVRVDRDRTGNATYYLDLYVTDNHYAEAMGVYYYNKDSGQFTTIHGEEGLRPLDTDRNATTRITYNITWLWDQISDGLLAHMNAASPEEVDEVSKKLTQIQVILYDYAFNSSFYTVDLYELLTTQNHTDVAFGDVGNYTSYSAPGLDTINLLTSTNDTIAVDGSGNYKTMDSIYIIPGQKVNLKNAVISYPDTAWREELEFYISEPDKQFIRFDDDTYELYALRQDDAEGEYTRAEATLTVRSRLAGSNVHKDLKVHILTNDEVAAYGINPDSVRERNEITGVSFEDGNSRWFNAGESYIVEAKTDPWFADFDTDKYFINWESELDIIATVAPLDPANEADRAEYANNGALKARITANACPRDEEGYYIETKIKLDEDGAQVRDKYGNLVYEPVLENGKAKRIPYTKNISDSVSIIATVCERLPDEEQLKNEKGEIVTPADIEEMGRKPESDDYKKYYAAYSDFANKHVFDPISGEWGSTTRATNSYIAAVYEEFVVSGNTLEGYHGAGGAVVIPDNLSITTIGDSLFARNDKITSIVFPEGLEVIGRAACAYMTELRSVKIPSTIQTIGEYAFVASYTSEQEGPKTKLTTVDMTACQTKPIKVSSYAFALQRFIGVDWEKSHTYFEQHPDYNYLTGTYSGARNPITLLNSGDSSKYNTELFDTHMVRVVGDYSFYDMEFAQYLDLSGLRSAGRVSFFGFGAALGYFGLGDATLKLSPSTVAGEASFVGSGITTLEIPSKRISQQMFLADTTNMDQTTGKGSFSRLKNIVFTEEADGLIIDEAAFTFNNIETITFECDVEAISDMAFAACYNLKTVTFNKTCREIGTQAFAECESLETIELPAGLEVLGNGAFANCTALQTVSINAACKLAPSDFSSSGSLEGDAEEMMDEASQQGAPFVGCPVFAAFTTADSSRNGKINDNLTISHGALYNGDGSKLVCVPCATVNIQQIMTDLSNGTVKVIGAYAFGGNTKLTDVTLPETIEKIEEGAFYSSSIKSITFNSKITEIPTAAFFSCADLEKVDFGASSKVQSIGELAFYGQVTNSSIQQDEIGNPARVAGNKLTNIVIPDSVTEDDEGNGGIGALAFAYNGLLESVTLSPNIKTIKEGTFFACSSLKYVASSDARPDEAMEGDLYLPNVTRVENLAFGGDELTYTNSATGDNVYISLPGAAFTMVWLEKCEFVGDEAFSSNFNLAYVDISAAKYIGDRAFAVGTRFFERNNMQTEKVTSLISVYFSDKLDTIGEAAFKDNVLLTYAIDSVNIGAAVNIGAEAFRGCTALTDIGVLRNVEKIGAYAFADTPITESTGSNAITFPKTLKELAPTAFSNTKVHAFDVNAENTTLMAEDGVVYKKVTNGYELVAYPTLKSDVEYTVKDGTVRIDAYSFNKVAKLIRVNIPGSVRTIGDGAFYDASVRIFNFTGLVAPELEAGTDMFETTANDIYYWQIYRNFYKPFSYTVTADEWMYNTIRQKNEYDATGEVTNDVGDVYEGINPSYTGGGYNDANDSYGLMLCRPSNATGFDNFIWSGYFEIEFVGPAVKEEVADTVSEMLTALPSDPNTVTLNDREAIEAARREYDRLSLDQKKFISEDLVKRLEDCEKAIIGLLGADVTAEDVKNIIDNLPDIDTLTEADRDAIAEARKAYNNMSASERAKLGADYADKLAALEAKLSELSVKKGGSGFGIGTMMLGVAAGLGVAAVACLIVMLVIKKKSKAPKKESK